MPIDVIGFAVAKVEAEKRGLPGQDANRIGVIGAVMPNPLTALVVARSMADRQAPPPATAGEVPVIRLDPPRDGGGSGSGGSGSTGGTGTGTDPTHGALLIRIGMAEEAAIAAKDAAAAAQQATEKLTQTVTDGFKTIEEKIKC